MAQEGGTFQIGIPIYVGVDLLDVAAPYEIFNWMKQELKGTREVAVQLLAAANKAVMTRDGLSFSPQNTFAEAPQLDLLWVPGGDPAALEKMMQDDAYQKFLKKQSKRATFVVSVCEGALLLASAGLLDGFEATTHWAFIPCLECYPKIKIDKGYPRFVVNKFKDKASGAWRYVVTGGGISSGLDEALELVRIIAGKKVAKSVQMTTQYYPKPPVEGKIKRAKSCPLPSEAG
ncbi:MAG TPA: DJ-1/PfpI family protein [Pyrinomonadaceae bacterium]